MASLLNTCSTLKLGGIIWRTGPVPRALALITAKRRVVEIWQCLFKMRCSDVHFLPFECSQSFRVFVCRLCHLIWVVNCYHIHYWIVISMSVLCWIVVILYGLGEAHCVSLWRSSLRLTTSRPNLEVSRGSCGYLFYWSEHSDKRFIHTSPH